MKSTSVRGTPYRKVENTAHEGIRPGVPKGFASQHTTNDAFRQAGINTDRTPEHGTPYHSQAGNGPETRRVVQHGTMVESSDHGNQNDPRSNGRGVVLDGANNYHNGFTPPHAPTLDSPVPETAPIFDTGTVIQEDRAHLGKRNEHGLRPLAEAGGVMSRGMIGTSKKGDTDEGELTKDDTLPQKAPAHRLPTRDAGAVRTRGGEFQTERKESGR